LLSLTTLLAGAELPFDASSQRTGEQHVLA